MMTVGLADATDTLQRVLVTDVTAQRIARIGRIGDDATATHDLGGTADEPGLRVDRMNLEILAQGG